MAGIIAIYGLVVSVIIGVNMKPDPSYTPYNGRPQIKTEYLYKDDKISFHLNLFNALVRRPLI